jgi:hypothetical protein
MPVDPVRCPITATPRQISSLCRWQPSDFYEIAMGLTTKQPPDALSRSKHTHQQSDTYQPYRQYQEVMQNYIPTYCEIAQIACKKQPPGTSSQTTHQPSQKLSTDRIGLVKTLEPDVDATQIGYPSDPVRCPERLSLWALVSVQSSSKTNLMFRCEEIQCFPRQDCQFPTLKSEQKVTVKKSTRCNNIDFEKNKCI